MTHDPHRKHAATARRARREFITSPDEPVFPDAALACDAWLEPAPNAPETEHLSQGYRLTEQSDWPDWTPPAWQSDTHRPPLADQPLPTSFAEANAAVEAFILRSRYKYAPAFTPHAAPANISPYPHRPQPMSRPHWSPRAYAGLRGLSANAAEMFTEIATAVQAARENTPW